MNVLSDYDEYVESSKHKEDIRILGRYIRHAFWPFQPGQITTFIEGFNRDVVIEFEHFPNYKLRIPVDYSGPGSVYDHIGREAWLLIRDIPRIEPPDNVVLGED